MPRIGSAADHQHGFPLWAVQPFPAGNRVPKDFSVRPRDYCLQFPSQFPPTVAGPAHWQMAESFEAFVVVASLLVADFDVPGTDGLRLLHLKLKVLACHWILSVADIAGSPLISVSPCLMPHRQSIQRLSAMLPLWHELVHQGDEAIIVRWFQQMHHFVNHDVFQAFRRLLGQICNKPGRSDAP